MLCIRVAKECPFGRYQLRRKYTAFEFHETRMRRSFFVAVMSVDKAQFWSMNGRFGEKRKSTLGRYVKLYITTLMHRSQLCIDRWAGSGFAQMPRGISERVSRHNFSVGVQWWSHPFQKTIMKDAPQHPFDLIDWLSGGPLAAHIDAFKHRRCN
jgi:hypothetical protein